MDEKLFNEYHALIVAVGKCTVNRGAARGPAGAVRT
jgi:hypothetical protein